MIALMILFKIIIKYKCICVFCWKENWPYHIELLQTSVEIVNFSQSFVVYNFSFSNTRFSCLLRLSVFIRKRLIYSEVRILITSPRCCELKSHTDFQHFKFNYLVSLYSKIFNFKNYIERLFYLYKNCFW